MAVKVGDKVPDFTIPSQMEENFTLSQFFGKKNVVLYFYSKDKTRGFIKEACEFRDKCEVFKELGADVIGVNSDNVKSHEIFAIKHNLPFFILLSDQDKNIRKLYGVPSTFGVIPGRVTYIIDKKWESLDISSLSSFSPKNKYKNPLISSKKLDISN